MSEESTSATLSQGLGHSLVSEKLLDFDTTKDILRRSLSVCTLNSVSITSSFAERRNNALFLPFGQQQLRDIGRGSCGSIFEIPGTDLAIKKGANVESIWKDYNLTNHAYNSYLKCLGMFEDAFPHHRVPRVPGARFYNGPDSADFWDATITRFPAADQTKAAIFHIDRILPIPTLAREALIQHFYQGDGKTRRDVLRNPENKDCLVRLYFGKNYGMVNLYDATDTLRNFPLYLDQAKAIGLNVNTYAEEMAIGLAILHWKAHIDAADTEFVIGRSSTTTFRLTYPDHQSRPSPTSTMDDFTRRETQIWMLDYDKCSRVDLKAKDAASQVVNKLLVAVTGNDPYFPHPCLDVQLWGQFKAAYLNASEIILRWQKLGENVAEFPVILMSRWEEWANEDVDAVDSDPFERDGDEDEDEGWDDNDVEENDTSEESEEEEEDDDR